MRVEGFWTCFNCQGNRKDENGSPYPLRKLEIRRVNPNQKNKKKKGKLIREAMVCTACYNDGHNKVPVGFSGEVKYQRNNVPDKVMQFLKKQKEEAEQKVEKAKELGVA